ncbi:MAG: ThuA domain-containing protein, partial [Chitinophagaceae bacterium]
MKTNRFFSGIALILSLLTIGCQKTRPGLPRILVFTKTAGYHHASIPDGIKAIQKLGEEHRFLVDTTTNANQFNEDSLKKYAAVVFLNTTGEVLNNYQQADFERYIQAGGGFVGVHAATDCGYTWPWYGKLVGAYFNGHPQPQNALVKVVDKNFPATKGLPDQWTRKDEWYNFRNFNPQVHVLVTLDEKSYQGGKMGNFHPVVWYHHFDGGRAFYMEFGHTRASYQGLNFLHLLLGGIQYAMDGNKELDYDEATTPRVPAEDRFTAKVLTRGFDEPTEMAILPNLDILISERKGPIMFYQDATKTLTQVAMLDVYHQASVPHVNAEEGVMGIAPDPHYSQNHWIYVYYAPKNKIVNRLSRFQFVNNQFNLKSEQIILEVHTRRQICCHTGGSIAFDASGNLFLSVGDNSTPFDEIDSSGKAYSINTHGYDPVDDRPGHQQYDDRRSAGNSNDLRGKILRIHVRANGTYDIPAGNHFPKGEHKTRPEIYVMGDRKPYRISVD